MQAKRSAIFIVRCCNFNQFRKNIMAHKAILASCSDYFETMFLAEVKYNFMADTANF